MYKGHIVFDCDGTLVSSMEQVFNALRTVVSAKLGRTVSYGEMVEKHDADFQVLLENFGMDRNTDAKSMLEAWSEAIKGQDSGYYLFPGIQGLIKRLRDENYALYVWTGRDRPSLERVLKAHDLMSSFVDWRGATDCEPKPSPQGILELTQGVDPRHVVVIGDSYVDIVGAKAAKAYAIGCTWCPLANKETLARYEADAIVQTSEECYNAISHYFRSKGA